MIADIIKQKILSKSFNLRKKKISKRWIGIALSKYNLFSLRSKVEFFI